MYEFSVLVKSGEEIILFGYGLKDACKRAGMDINDVKKVMEAHYVD